MHALRFLPIAQRILVLVGLCALALGGCTPGTGGSAFYVAPEGDDNGSGAISQPFATAIRAREAVRSLKTGPGLPDGGVTVYFRGGIYPFNETLTLTENDAGTEEAPVTWQAYPGETVQIIGGQVLSGFEPLTDPAVRERTDPAFHDRIVQCELADLGITDFGELRQTGQGMPGQPNALELFFNGSRMTIARYPNEGWARIATVPQSGDSMIYAGLDRDTSAIPAGRHYGRFGYDGDRPSRWQDTSDIWMFGYWMWDWAYQYQQVAKIDTKAREIYPMPPYHGYGYLPGQRYYFYNILEELDSPGEWYLDRAQGMLYFWPPAPLDTAEAFVSVLEEPFIRMDNTSHVTIRDITFEGNRVDAIEISGGSANRIAGCVIRNVGNDAVIIDGGTDNGVIGCDIAHPGGRGITISGGDRMTLVPGNNYAVNNHIHHFSAVYRTYHPAITLSGVGNRMTHNHIHDAPHMAVGFSGNDHLIEYNDIHDVAQETGDVGAIYTGRDWTMRGHVIRYNYIHDITGPADIGGEHFTDAMGVYLDDSFSSAHVYGNVFKALTRAVMIGGGRDNTVENNIFIDCGPSIHIDSRSQGWANRYQQPGGSHRMYEKLDEINHDEPPYSTRYPKLASMLDEEPHLAAGNVIRRNVSDGRLWMNINDGLDFSVVTVADNVIADSVAVTWERAKPGDQSNRVTLMPDDPEIRSILESTGNRFVDDIGLLGLEEADYQFAPDSPALDIGFEQIPFDEIGLVVDEFRETLLEPGHKF